MGNSKKFWKLKNWLTLEGAARFLSSIFDGEDVTVADIYQLALEGHLRLCIDLVNPVMARKGSFVDLSDYLQSSFPEMTGSQRQAVKGLFGTDRLFVENGQLTKVDGLWDLLLEEDGRFEIEHRFHQETGGPEVSKRSESGHLILCREDYGYVRLYEELDRFEQNSEDATDTCGVEHIELFSQETIEKLESMDWPKSDGRSSRIPTMVVPDGARIVVLRTELEKLVEEPGAEASENVSPREKSSLNRIIAVLLEQLTDQKNCNQTTVINQILDRYPTASGLSETNLKVHFARAKKYHPSSD